MSEEKTNALKQKQDMFALSFFFYLARIRFQSIEFSTQHFDRAK